jgi:tyrosine-protein kinase Etk/Wzc
MGPEDRRSGEGGTSRTQKYFVKEYLSILVTWRRLSIVLLGCVAVASLIAALALPRVFESETRLLPVGDFDALNAGRLRTLSQFSSIVDFGAFGGGENAKVALLSILDSDLFRSRVARDLDLVDRLKIDAPDSAVAVSLAGRALGGILSVSVNKWDNIIVTARHEDPVMVIALLESVIRQLEQVQQDMNLTTARQTRRFIERRMAEAELAYQAAEQKLVAFQKEHEIIAVEEQQSALVKLAAQLEAEITLKQAELNTAQTFFSDRYGKIHKLEVEIGSLRSELNRLLQADSTDTGGSVQQGGPSLHDLPDLGAQFVRFQMDVEIQQSLLLLLAQQYEQAKINEVREVTSFEVVDPPRVPPKAIRTRKSVALTGAVVGILAALIFPLLLESLGRYLPADVRKETGTLLRRLVSWR